MIVDYRVTIVYYLAGGNMKFITVRDLRTRPADIWRELPEAREMVLTNNGRPIALLTPIENDDIESSLSAVRRAKAIVAVQKLQQESIRKYPQGLKEEELESEIRETRKRMK